MVEILVVGAFGRMGKAIQEILNSEDCGARLSGLIVEEKEREALSSAIIEETISKGVPPFGTPLEPSPFGTSLEPSPFGPPLEPSPFGTSLEPSPFGTPLEPSPFGTSLEPSSFGSAVGNSQFGNLPIYYSIQEAIKHVPDGVVIDFSTPTATLAVAKETAKVGMPLVIGTTGFTEEEKNILSMYAMQCPILLSSNMSKGINTLLKLLPYFVESLGDEYDIEIVETHHKKKKDAPSGTALSLAEVLAKAKEWELSKTACYCREGIIGERPIKEIGIQTVRGGGVAGIHTVSFLAEEERIEITHHAHSRKTFARGAIHAGVWLQDKKATGLYSMMDTI